MVQAQCLGLWADTHTPVCELDLKSCTCFPPSPSYAFLRCSVWCRTSRSRTCVRPSLPMSPCASVCGAAGTSSVCTYLFRLLLFLYPQCVVPYLATLLSDTSASVRCLALRALVQVMCSVQVCVGVFSLSLGDFGCTHAVSDGHCSMRMGRNAGGTKALSFVQCKAKELYSRA